MPAGQAIVVNTDNGEIRVFGGAVIRAAGTGIVNGIGFRTASQGTGVPEVAIFSLASLTVASPSGGADGLYIAGSRSAILVAAGAVTIAGRVDAAAGRANQQDAAGPGGGAGGTFAAPAGGCAPGQPGNFSVEQDETGGGGGGNGSVGAAGGASGVAAGGAVTASLGACAGPDLVPIVGGSGGARGAGDPAGTGIGVAVGGGGGGAVQITSFTSMTVSGAMSDLYAGGAGGTGSVVELGGGGGGAGGGILLEAPTVTISGGKITANGGGGGSGREANRGDNGNRAATRASGGAGSGGNGDTGRGGLGSIGAAATQEATIGGGETNGTGGGGGGAGVIRINTVSPASISDAVISPRHTTGTLSVQ
ncbi:MAG TPA: hypothetical protein VM734_25275 [Kofleriaceae bacterium]|nr:hypothetical protein [Kofleriaceae bacterium]